MQTQAKENSYLERTLCIFFFFFFNCFWVFLLSFLFSSCYWKGGQTPECFSFLPGWWCGKDAQVTCKVEKSQSAVVLSPL